MGYEGAVGHEWRGVRGVMFDSVVSARCYALLSIGNRRVSEYLQRGKCGSERVFVRCRDTAEFSNLTQSE